MDTILKELSALSAGTLAAIGALAAATGTIVAALVTAILGKIIVSPFLSARDRLDKEAEWRKHAIELTKLDLEGKLKTRVETDKDPIRPSILNFLANYRDLEELGTKSPKDLYLAIIEKRIKDPNPAPIAATSASHTSTLLRRLLLGASLLVLLMAATFRSRS